MYTKIFKYLKYLDTILSTEHDWAGKIDICLNKTPNNIFRTKKNVCLIQTFSKKTKARL